jgi:hypothetical protein
MCIELLWLMMGTSGKCMEEDFSSMQLKRNFMKSMDIVITPISVVLAVLCSYTASQLLLP